MQYSNLHQHTTFSDGKDSLEDVVLSAINHNVKSIGISDHSFLDVCETTCKMDAPDSPEYLNEIKRVKEKYKDKIAVYTGIEKDYFSKIDSAKYDYVIASVHFMVAGGKYYAIDHARDVQQDYIDDVCGGDILKFVRDYYDLVVKHVRESRPDIVGHFDVITKFGLIDESDGYKKIALNALDEVLKYCDIVEVNTGAIIRGYRTVPYPAKFLLEEILRRNASVILSSDSHNKATVIGYFDEAVKLLKSIGFKTVKQFENGKFIDVEL